MDLNLELYWLWIVPVLGILVVVHELGHFWTALLFKIRVEEFGVGFPPRVFAVRRNGIDYSLNWLPIGGFVKIVGENGDSDDPSSFGKAPAWQRIIVLAAGSAMNLLLALIIFMGLSISGVRQTANTNGVAFIDEAQPAAKAGMLPGDQIVRVNGRPVTSSDQIRALNRERAGQATEYVVLRDGQEKPLMVTPNSNPVGTAYLGIILDAYTTNVKVNFIRKDGLAEKAGLQVGDEIVAVNGAPVKNLPLALNVISESIKYPSLTVRRNGGTAEPITFNAGTGDDRLKSFNVERPYTTVHYGPMEALGRALDNTWQVLSSVPRGIASAFAGQARGPAVTGIVGIGQLTGEVAEEGGMNGLLNLTALLGISLFMINLLPLPALDGGRLLFILLELLRGGRRIAPEKEGMVHFAGMVVLLALMVIITFFDVQRLLTGGRIMGP